MKFEQIQKFKETEIGKIPFDWNVVKQKEVAEFLNGRAYKLEEFTTEGTPLIRIQNLTGTKDWIYSDLELDETKYIEKNDLVYAWSATFGPYIWNGPKAIFHYHIWKILCNSEKLDKIFFYFKLKHVSDSIRQKGTGSVMDHITKELMENSLISLPSLSEQKKIGKILYDIDSKIQNLQNQNKVLEQIAQTIFKSWFVDYDGVTEFEDSELGKIPKRWTVIPFREIADCVKGFSYKGIEKFHEPRGYEFVTLNSIKEGGGFKKKFKWLKSDRLKERHFVNEMDLVIANTEQTKDARLLATPALVQFSYNYDQSLAVYSHHITKIKPKITHSKFYLYSFFLYYQQNIANAYHTGTGVWGFDNSNFENNYLVLKPTNSILVKFEKISFELHVKIIENDKSVSLLTHLTDILLPKLMSGEIRVL